MSSRLYYPKTQAGKLAGGRRTRADLSDATKKVAKNIPAELVTAYGALVSAAMALKWQHVRFVVAIACFVICWGLTPIYLNMVADKGKPKRNQIIVGTMAFPVWAYIVSCNAIFPEYYDVAVATIAAILFSTVVALVPMNR